MRARLEPFGAWVRTNDATLVALSRAGAKRLGLDGGELWRDPIEAASATRPRAPLEVHVAVTSRCAAGCTGCYLDARPDGDSPPFDELAARLDAVAARGAFTVAFGGGEPLGRADLGELAAHARARGLVPVVTTSGLGMTAEKAARLAPFAQVNVSYDGVGAAYEGVRGFDGAAVAERAMALLQAAGVPFGVNVVLTRGSFDALPETLARADALGAREAQLLRYKPAGRAASLTYLETRLTPEQVERLPRVLEEQSRARSLSLRVDCALVPLLSGGDLDLDAEQLGRFGVFGCEAGRHLEALDVTGAARPCSFAPEGADRGAWREPPSDAPCATCSLRAVCRGGCKVVARHVTGDLGPDPECPRVRAHARA
jgi:radical SAM protein with 4Fe4S-binding SPASM domain